jgi:hypothetical protein
MPGYGYGSGMKKATTAKKKKPMVAKKTMPKKSTRKA